LLAAVVAVSRGQSVVAAVEQAMRVEGAMAELRVRGQTSTPRLDGRRAQELRPLVATLVHATPPATVVGRVLGRWQRIGAALDVKAVAKVPDAESWRRWERLPTEAMFAVQAHDDHDDDHDDDAIVMVVDEVVERWKRQLATRLAKPKDMQTIWDSSANSTTVAAVRDEYRPLLLSCHPTNIDDVFSPRFTTPWAPHHGQDGAQMNFRYIPIHERRYDFFINHCRACALSPL
jgi:hypothetical protein